MCAAPHLALSPLTTLVEKRHEQRLLSLVKSHNKPTKRPRHVHTHADIGVDKQGQKVLGFSTVSREEIGSFKQLLDPSGARHPHRRRAVARQSLNDLSQGGEVKQRRLAWWVRCTHDGGELVCGCLMQGDGIGVSTVEKTEESGGETMGAFRRCHRRYTTDGLHSSEVYLQPP
jgi:hypothetical protein